MQRTVDSLATELGVSVANASQHLQTLRQSRLVSSRKDGLFVHYRLADPEVSTCRKSFDWWPNDVWPSSNDRRNEHFGNRHHAEPVPMDELLRRARSRQVVILDTRPATELTSLGTIPGALSIRVDDPQRRLKELTKGQGIRRSIAAAGIGSPDRAVRFSAPTVAARDGLAEAIPEWRLAGFPCRKEGSQAH